MVNGRVELLRDKKPLSACKLYMQLETGDQIRVAAGGQATIILYRRRVRYQLRETSVTRVEGEGVQLLSGAAPRKLPPLSEPAVRAMRTSFSGQFLGVTVRGGNED